MKTILRTMLRRLGIDVVRCSPNDPLGLAGFPDISDTQRRIITAVRPYTMTSIERIASLVDAVDYVTKNNIPGNIAECGVWRGGSMMTVALTLLAQNDTSRNLYLYDTFEGMSPPTEHDKSFDGDSAASQLSQDRGKTGIWCYADLDDVRRNLLSTGYPEAKIHLIKGKVEDTIPVTLPDNLALLRLDTDWYESTKHELVHLFPLLDPRGVLVIDDYGHWQGARKAVDEYFEEQKRNIYFHRVDYTGRIAVGIGT